MSSRRHDIALNDYFERLLTAPLAEPAPALAPYAEPVPVASAVHAAPLAKVLPLRQIERLLAEVVTETVPVIDWHADPHSLVGESVALITDILADSAVADSEPATLAVSGVLAAITGFREQLPVRFQTLIFQVGELRLALPLHLLGGILRRDKSVTPLFGKAPWFMGLLTHTPDNIQVVDAAQFLLGERWQGDTSSDYRFVIVLGDSAWGLACHAICHTIVLERDDVRWFAGADKRPWLAGMLKDEKCALLNSDALKQMLSEA